MTSQLMRKFGKLVADNSPSILTGIAVTGSLTTAFLTGRATLKAVHHTQKKAYDEGIIKLSDKEQIKLVWKFYIPPAATAVVTIAAIVTANRIGTRRAAALAAAYSITERAFSEYKDKIVEKLGVKKEQAFQDEIAQDRVTKDPVTTREVIITGTGKQLCYESFTGRYFESDVETLRRAENTINNQINHDSFASLTDFYYLVGLPATGLSDEVGWNSDNLVDLKFSGTLTEDSRPCICFTFSVVPVRNYYKFG